MNDRITVRTGELTDGRIFQDIEDIHGQITRRIANVSAMQMEEAVRAKLIELGWTPPGLTPFIKVHDAIRGTVEVTKVFPGDIIAEEYTVGAVHQAEIHKIAKKYMTKRQQGHFMGEIRQLLGVKNELAKS